MMRLLIRDPDALLTKARTDRRAAEGELISAIIRRRDEVSPATLSSALSSLKSFFEFEEVPMNWKKIRSVAPGGKIVGRDRAPTLEELRAAMKLASPRERAAMLIMASGGLRIGALPGLKLKDIEYLESGLAKITVYAGEPEEYQTFVTPECVDSIRDYLAARERIGEKLTPDSLFFRDKWDYQGDKRHKKILPGVPHPVNEHAMRTQILRLWQRAGARKVNDGRPFKSDHGLRKFAKTQFSRAGIPWENGEILLGHSFNYNKPSMEQLQEEYLKAVPFLSVDEKYALKSELERKDKDHESQWMKVRIENFERDKEMEKVLAKQSEQDRFIDLIMNGAKTDSRLMALLAEMAKGRKGPGPSDK